MVTLTVIFSCIFKLGITDGQNKVKTVSLSTSTESGWNSWVFFICIVNQASGSLFRLLAVPRYIITPFRDTALLIFVNHSINFTVNRDGLTQLDWFNLRLSHNNLSKTTCVEQVITAQIIIYYFIAWIYIQKITCNNICNVFYLACCRVSKIIKRTKSCWLLDLLSWTEA